MHDFAAYRRNMIESQIRTNQVTDAMVLEAFATVPRELFVPASLAACARRMPPTLPPRERPAVMRPA